MTAENPEGLSVSAKFVNHVLEDQGPLSPSDIQQKTGLSEPTVTRALRRLRQADQVKRTHTTRDGRKCLYDSK